MTNHASGPRISGGGVVYAVDAQGNQTGERRSRAASEPGEVARLADEAISKMIDFAEDVWQAGKDGFRCDSIAPCRERRAAAEAAIRRLASMATSQASEAQAGLPLTQEPKYTVNGSAIVNRASGEAIPADEPVFIFRARDKYAADVIGDYAAQFCTDPAHAAAVEARFIQFSEWAEAHPERMKEPDTAAAPLPASSLAELPGMWEESDLSGGATDCLTASSPVSAEPDLHALISAWSSRENAYIDNYEFDDGENATHTPTEFERMLITDAVAGLLADEEWSEAYHAWDVARRAGGYKPWSASADDAVAWYEVETPGADFDISFVQTMEEAIQLNEGDPDAASYIQPLFYAAPSEARATPGPRGENAGGVVEAKPFGWYGESRFNNDFTTNEDTSRRWHANGYRLTPLYTRPSPAPDRGLRIAEKGDAS